MAEYNLIAVTSAPHLAARRVLRSLTAIVAEAERRGYVAKNPCSGVTVRKANRDKVKPQFSRVMEANFAIFAI